MADEALLAAGVVEAPFNYTIPGAQEIILKSVAASFDGTGAAGSFIPTLQFVAPNGTILASCNAPMLAAGASADVSWFPWCGLGAETPAPPVPTLIAWYDFSNASSITLDGSGNISAIADLSGNGHTATQATAAQRPGQGTVNGLTTGVFAASANTYLQSDPFEFTTAFTATSVGLQSAATDSTHFPKFWASGPGKQLHLFQNGPFNALAFQQGGNAYTFAITAPYTQQQTSCLSAAGSFNGDFRLNGSDAHGGGPIGGATIDQGLTLGHYYNGQNDAGHFDGLTGELCELMFWALTLQSPQLGVVESYLKSKWATP